MGHKAANPKFALLAVSMAICAGWTMSRAALARPGYGDGELRQSETGDESKVRELREAEITELRITLGRRVPRDRRADLYFRLAELYLEAYHEEYLLEGRVHDRRLAQGDQDPRIDHSHSRRYLDDGVRACKEILSYGIPYSKMDQVYYFMGFNYGELQERRQSLRYFELLTERYPNSRFVGEAYRQLGEAAYADNQFRKALGYLEAAAKKSEPDLLPQVEHKLAWCYFRTRQFDQAIGTMKEAVELARKNGEKYLSLHEEALRDMAIFMTEAGRVEEAIEYFQRTIGDKMYYPKVLERLGKQYERNVEPDKATQVYESLLKTHPESEATFRVLVKLVDLDLRRGQYQLALSRLNRLREPNSPDDETLVAGRNLRAMVRRTATEHHEEFRKKGDRAALEVAEAYYSAYLSAFLAHDDPRRETPEIEMYLAEVERDLGKSREASELYRKVLESRDKRYAKEAGALWTASLAEAIRKSQGVPGSAAEAKAGEPSDLERQYIDAADQLQGNLGDTSEGREAALRAAQVLAGHRDTKKEAASRLKDIIGKYPGSAQANTAARLWIQLYSDGKSDEDLKDTLERVKSNEALMSADRDSRKGKLHAAIAEQESRLKIGAIARNEKDRDFGAAAKGYESFAQDATQRDLAERAYASAIGAYRKADDRKAIDRVLRLWTARYPKSPKALETLRDVATQDLIQGRFEESGSAFEKIGAQNGDADSIETAAWIFEGIGDAKRAQSDWAYHAEHFANSPRRGTVLLALAKSYEVSQMDSEAVRAYRQCMSVSEPLEAECGVRLSELYHRLRSDDEALSLLKSVAARTAGRKGEALSPFVGYARYQLATRLAESRSFGPMELPEAKLRKALNERLQFLEPLSRAYNSVVDAGGPWAIAALDGLAKWARGFADEINRIAPPPGASAAKAAAFRAQLRAISEPLRRKAVETWRQAYNKAVAAEALSPALPDLADRLADEKSPSPARAQGFRGKLRIAGIPADGGADGADTALSGIRDRLTREPQDAAAWVDYGNLLWGQGKPGLARIAYDRALSLNPRNPAALNNRGVTLMTAGGSEEDWAVAETGYDLFVRALKQDEFFFPAKFNRALLLNYYRLFEKARPLWQQILVRNQLADAQDGLGVALEGTGDFAQAEAAFRKASDLGASSSRFVYLYFQAARASADGAKGAEQCLSALDDVGSGSLGGFEKTAYDNLRRTCTSWKTPK